MYVEHDDFDVYIGKAVDQPAAPGRARFRRGTADLEEIVASVPVLSFGVFGNAGAGDHGGVDVRRRTLIPSSHGDFGGHGVTVGPNGHSKLERVLADRELAGIYRAWSRSATARMTANCSLVPRSHSSPKTPTKTR